MTKKKKSKHDLILEDIVNRLQNKKYYDFVARNVLYGKREFYGEMDILTYKDKHWHYYEIKTHRSPQQIRKARYQAYKVSKAFPERNFKYILITTEGIKRIEPEDVNKRKRVYRKRNRHSS